MLRLDAPVGLEVGAERQQTIFESRLARRGGLVTGHHQEKSPYSPLPVIDTRFGYTRAGPLLERGALRGF
jgi:hypothetical protein